MVSTVLNGPKPTIVLAAIKMLYVVKGVRVSISKMGDSETNWNISSDPTTLALMKYAVILPFWSSRRGGFQVRVADRDDISVAVMFCGEPLGTAWKTTKK